MSRGEIWWADLPDPIGSAPGYRRPALILQANSFTQSPLATVIVVLLTTNFRLKGSLGNVVVQAKESGLPRDSIVNVTQMLTVDKTALDVRVGTLTPKTMFAVEQGMRLVLDL